MKVRKLLILTPSDSCTKKSLRAEATTTKTKDCVTRGAEKLILVRLNNYPLIYLKVGQEISCGSITFHYLNAIENSARNILPFELLKIEPQL